MRVCIRVCVGRGSRAGWKGSFLSKHTHIQFGRFSQLLLMIVRGWGLYDKWYLFKTCHFLGDLRDDSFKPPETLKNKNFTFLAAVSSLAVIYVASIAGGIIFLGIYGAVTIHVIHLQNQGHKACNLQEALANLCIIHV